METAEQPRVVLTDPKPLPKSAACPQCRAGKDRRVRSGGFGAFHDVCGQCGFEFEERTV